MARPLRIEFPGALYHVISRGNAKQDIFLDDGDRHQFLDALSETAERLNWRILVYCLMTNHYHLCIETVEPTLARGMRDLNGRYALRVAIMDARNELPLALGGFEDAPRYFTVEMPITTPGTMMAT